MSKEKLYKTFFRMGIAFLKLSFAAWLDEEKAKEKLKEVYFFTMLEKIVQHGKPTNDKTSTFKERLNKSLENQKQGGFVPPNIKDTHEYIKPK